jgi:hypothetical protein
MKNFLFLFLLGLSSASFSQLAQMPNDLKDPPATPAEPEVVEETLDALNTKAITAAMGKTATVSGTVTETFWVRDSVLLVTFQDSRDGFVGVSFTRYRDGLDAAFNGNIVAALKGKTIEITGKIVEYEYRPQIVIENSDQIKILD